MNKSEFVKELAREAGITQKVAAEAVNKFGDIIIRELAAGAFVDTGFGKFETARRAARKGTNPKTGETIDIPEKIVAKFKPAKKLRDELEVMG